MQSPGIKKGAPLFPDPRGISDKKAREGAALMHLNPPRAFQCFHQAAEYGHPGANFECGSYHERGIRDFLQPNLKEAARHYMLATFGGLPHARYNLAFFYERGAGGLRTSSDRCLQLLDAAAEAGHGGAANAIADRLFKGVVRDRTTEVEDFPEEAIYYWLLAAKEGVPRATMALSVVFTEGIVIQEPDHDLSSRFAELALMQWWMSIRDSSNKPAAVNSVTSGQAKTSDGGRSRTPDGKKDRKEGKKRKSDRVLRLPSYFNRCGAAALVRERVLNRLLAKGPLKIEEVLEKAKNRSGGVIRRGGSANSLQGPSPVTAMIEWLASLKTVDAHEATIDGDLSDNDDIDDDPDDWERQVVAIGPRFTFRNPEVSILVLKDFKKLGYLESSFKRPELHQTKKSSDSDNDGNKRNGKGDNGGGGGSIGGDSSDSDRSGKPRKRASQALMFNPQQRLGTLQEQRPSFN